MLFAPRLFLFTGSAFFCTLAGLGFGADTTGFGLSDRSICSIGYDTSNSSTGSGLFELGVISFLDLIIGWIDVGVSETLTGSGFAACFST